jgi:hypothetical protein
MRPWDSAQPCARRQAQIDQGGFADAAAVTVTARAAEASAGTTVRVSTVSAVRSPAAVTKPPHPAISRCSREIRSLNLLGATRIDRQKHVALIGADLRIADHCPDWPPRVPRLASRHAIPLLQVPASAAALVNPDLALSRHDSVAPVRPYPTARREPTPSPDFGGLTTSLRATAMVPGIALTAPSLPA